MDELTLYYNADRMELTISPISSSRLHNITEVVRCKDCKYLKKSRVKDCYRCENLYAGMTALAELKGDEFCSYGERREGE